MVRFIIPQSDAVSPVDIRSSHWHKYLGDIIKDYILTGLGLSAGAGLNVSVAAGRGYMRGIDFESDAVESVAVVASATNHIFAQLLFDGELEPTGWQFVVNQTGTPPADSILLGTATTSASAVTGTDTATTVQGLTLKEFSAGGDIKLGANKLKTTNLILKELDSTALAIQNAADTAALGLRLADIRTSTIFSFDFVSAITIANVTAAMDFKNREVSNLLAKDPRLLFSSRLQLPLPPVHAMYSVVGTAVQSGATVRLTTGTAIGDESVISVDPVGTSQAYGAHGNRRSELNVAIFIPSTADVEIEVGVSRDATPADLLDNTDNHMTIVYDASASANWIARNANGVNQTSTTSTKPVTTQVHVLTIIYNETSIEFYVDGVLIATHTTNISPLIEMAPLMVFVQTEVAAEKELRYLGGTFYQDAVA